MTNWWKKCFQTIGRKKAKDARRVENELHKELVEAEERIQCDPANLEALNVVTMARDAFRKK